MKGAKDFSNIQNFLTESIFELVNTQLEDEIITLIIGINKQYPKGFMF